MNEITLKGKIYDIAFSHKIKNTEFYKAIVEAEREDGKLDFITIKFKKDYCTYNEGDYVELVGNIRSYSYETEEGKNKVDIYVFTYFDKPENNESKNSFIIDGRVCKINKLYVTKNGNYSLQFTLANNIYDESRNLKFNSYLPIVCWGKDALELNNQLNVNDELIITGEMHSRTYTKIIDNEEVGFQVQELVVKEVK